MTTNDDSGAFADIEYEVRKNIYWTFTPVRKTRVERE